MDKKVPKEIEDCLQTDEKLLWWGKPNKKIISSEEKAYGFYGIIIILWMTIPFSLSFKHGVVSGIYESLKIAAPFILIFLISFIIFWINKKQNTWFAITDQRVIRLYENILSTPLSNIRHFEVINNKVGGNLYLGKFRRRPGRSHFDYEKGYIDLYNETQKNYGKIYTLLYLSKLYKSADYLFFFDLIDVDTPAQIIRERTNAKEYIDPKRKQI